MSTSASPEAVSPSPFVTVTDLEKGLNSKPDFLLEDLFERGDQMLLYGQPKVGKTFLAIQLSCSLALGRPFLGWKIPTEQNIPIKRKVLYINFEMGERVFASRIALNLGIEAPSADDVGARKAWFQACNEKLDGNLVFTVAPRNINISDQKDYGDLAALIKEHRPDVVVFDTLAKLHSVDESVNKPIQEVLTTVRNVCQLENNALAHVIVHHARKGSLSADGRARALTATDIRGASAIRGEADVIIGLGREPGGSKGGARTILAMEARNVQVDDLELTFDESTRQFRLEKTGADIKGDIFSIAVDYLTGRVGRSTLRELEQHIAGKINWQHQTVRRDFTIIRRSELGRVFHSDKMKGHGNTLFIRLKTEAELDANEEKRKAARSLAPKESGLEKNTSNRKPPEKGTDRVKGRTANSIGFASEETEEASPQRKRKVGEKPRRKARPRAVGPTR